MSLFQKKHILPSDVFKKISGLSALIGLPVNKTLLRACAVLEDIHNDIDSSILRLTEISLRKKKITMSESQKEVFLNVLSGDFSCSLPMDDQVLVYLRSDSVLVVDSNIIPFSLEDPESVMFMGIASMLDSGKAISVPIWSLSEFPELLAGSRDFKKKVFRKRTLYNRIEELTENPKNITPKDLGKLRDMINSSKVISVN